MGVFVHLREGWSTALSVVLGLLLLLPASPHATSDLVLCVERSGEVNVEQSHEGECTGPSAESRSQDRAPDLLDVSAGEHCGDCEDLPLRLTDATDPCGTAIAPSWSVDIDGPAKRLSLEARVSGTPEVTSSSLPPGLFANQALAAASHASLGSTVLLI